MRMIVAIAVLLGACGGADRGAGRWMLDLSQGSTVILSFSESGAAETLNTGSETMPTIDSADEIRAYAIDGSRFYTISFDSEPTHGYFCTHLKVLFDANGKPYPTPAYAVSCEVFSGRRE